MNPLSAAPLLKKNHSGSRGSSLKKVYVAATGLWCLLLASDAQAGGYYIEGQFGGASALQVENTDEIETESEFAFWGALAVGHKFEDAFGIDGLNAYAEGHLGVRDFDLHGLNRNGANSAATGDIRSIGLSSNLWLALELTPSFEIYAGGGPGVALMSIDNINSAGAGFNDDSESGLSLSYTLGAGAIYNISEDLAVNLGYRFAAVPRYEVGSYEGELTSHEVMLGVRFNF